ncbi:MAG: hypothetical protein MI810_01425 [Flavobacteriales bacterium]|jgi:hypothetical protein|nr:hypothetical protein [Flavobacteriales bacterium]
MTRFKQFLIIPLALTACISTPDSGENTTEEETDESTEQTIDETTSPADCFANYTSAFTANEDLMFEILNEEGLMENTRTSFIEIFGLIYQEGAIGEYQLSVEDSESLEFINENNMLFVDLGSCCESMLLDEEWTENQAAFIELYPELSESGYMNTEAAVEILGKMSDEEFEGRVHDLAMVYLTFTLFRDHHSWA